MNRSLALLPLAALALSSCSDEPARGEGPLRVVATIGMIADVVRSVAGPHAEVEGIIGEGVDPHLYKPTAADVKAMQSADIVFYNGLMLEGKMADVLVKLAGSGRAVHAVTEAVLEDPDFVLTDEEEHDDPHVWMDVAAWSKAVSVIEKGLSEADPANAASYRENASAYREQLAGLDTYAREVLATVPPERRVLVTAHDAFGYLARAYGIEVRGVQGLSTESEAGVKDIEDLVSFLVERKIPAVFVESSVSDKNIRALLEGAAAKGHEVVIGGELFSDAMGPAGSYEGTYIGMIDHNVTTITRALGGNAPEKGFRGKLSTSHP